MTDGKQSNIVDFLAFSRAWSSDEQAASWFIRHQVEELSEQEKKKFKQWCDERPGNYEQYLDVAVVWESFHSDRLAARAAEGSAARELSALVESYRPGQSGRKSVKRRVSIGAIRWLSVACLVLLIATSALFISDVNTRKNVTISYRTEVKEIDTHELKDGSLITMNASSSISVSLGDKIRKIELYEGEAVFSVAHDPERPFVVDVGGTLVRAVGTVFNIERGRDDVVVTVLEGIVEVTKARKAVASGANAAVLQEIKRLVHGEKLEISQNSPVLGDVIHANIEVDMAWQEGNLIFENEPFHRVVERISRYVNEKIIINDAQLSEMRLSGVYRIEEADTILPILATILPIRVNQIDEHLIVVERKVAPFVRP